MPDNYMDAAAVPVPDAGDDTLREQLADIALRVITDHEPRHMGCACGAQIGDDIDRRWHLVNRAIAAATEHVAAAVQAERERIGHKLIEASGDQVPKGPRQAALWDAGHYFLDEPETSHD